MATTEQNRSAICILSRSNNRESINPPLPSPSVSTFYNCTDPLSFSPRKVAVVDLCCAVLFEFVARRQKKGIHPRRPSSRVQNPFSDISGVVTWF